MLCRRSLNKQMRHLGHNTRLCHNEANGSEDKGEGVRDKEIKAATDPF